ncbi:MAG: O-antigen ligase family protein, partial [Pirellulales bacterium]|nr:O-antigen ligase family protein [Pirellulales bacterium]
MVLSTRRTIEGLLLRAVDCGLAGSIFVVPLLMGGRHALGQLVLTVFAVAAAWAWCLRQCLRDDDNAWRPTAALPLLLLGALLLIVQAVPLPYGLLSKLTPHAAEVLPLWTAGGDNPARLGSWPYVSFTPAATLAALVVFLHYALLFLVAVQRIRRIEDVERLLRWCALTAVIMAALGVLQLLFGNGKFLWFYEHPLSLASGAAKGTFTNRNHFTQFLALGVGPLIWWLQDSMRRSHGTGANSLLKKCATAGLSSSAGENSRKNTAGQASSGTQTPGNQLFQRASKRGRSPGTSISRGELTTYMLGLALGLVLFAGLLSLSRGGILAMLIAATITAAVCYRTAALGGRLLAALAISGALIGASLGIFGYERVSNRLESLTSGSLEKIDYSAGRRTIWTATVGASADFLPLGTGAGSFRKVYPMYTDLLSDKRLDSTHAENSYLQELLETGAVGAILMLVGIGLCVFWCVGGIWSSVPTRYQICSAAIAGSLAASLAHALVDFVWYVPACMAMAIILAACAQRVWQLSRGEGRGARDEGWLKAEGGRRKAESEGMFSGRRHGGPLAPRPSPLAPRLAWPAIVVALTFVGGWMIVDRAGPAMAQRFWDEYFVARNVMHIRPATDQNPESADEKIQRRWIACLDNVVRRSPTHIKAHLALAEAHRRLFDSLQAKSENRMSLAHIRGAALQSRFPSREALDGWLSRAVGDHWVHLQQCLDHTLKALLLCPLEGRAYVYLAELSFLRGGNDAVRHSYLQQALRVRPYDGAVLQAAASEALLAGDVRGWLDYAKRAFRSGPRRQRQIIGELTSATPAKDLPAVADYVIREFQPDLEGLRLLHAECAKRCPPEQLKSLTRCRIKKAEAEATKLGNVEAARVWMEARLL